MPTAPTALIQTNDRDSTGAQRLPPSAADVAAAPNPDWDVLFNAVTARLRGIAGALEALPGPAGLPQHARSRVLECAEALDQLHETMSRQQAVQRALQQQLDSVHGDLAQTRATLADTRHSALHDALTTLPNREHFHDVLGRALMKTEQAPPNERPTKRPSLALLYLDLDGFKPINDQHGHAAGDAALRAVAQICEGCIREGDLLARLGGDEFAVLLERCSLEVASRVAEDIRKAVADLRIAWRGETLSLGISIGVAGLDAGIDDVAAWLAAADAACYEAKAQGRDTVRHARHPPLHLLLPAEGAAA